VATDQQFSVVKIVKSKSVGN